MDKNKIQIVKDISTKVCPPILLDFIKLLYRSYLSNKMISSKETNTPNKQDMDLYWDPKMAEMLDTWGEMNVWKEIQLLMVNCKGKVLDIACGTGKTMEIVSIFPIDVHGCDISDLLIGKAIERGILQDHVTICDATQLPYEKTIFITRTQLGH